MAFGGFPQPVYDHQFCDNTSGQITIEFLNLNWGQDISPILRSEAAAAISFIHSFLPRQKACDKVRPTKMCPLQTKSKKTQTVTMICPNVWSIYQYLGSLGGKCRYIHRIHSEHRILSGCISWISSWCWYVWWFRNPAFTSWGEGRLSPFIYRVLASSNRWLALGFLVAIKTVSSGSWWILLSVFLCLGHHHVNSCFWFHLIGGIGDIQSPNRQCISGIQAVYTANWRIIWYLSPLMGNQETPLTMLKYCLNK